MRPCVSSFRSILTALKLESRADPSPVSGSSSGGESTGVSSPTQTGVRGI